MEELLNVEEAAKFLRVSPRTVYEMTSAGTHYAVDPGVDAGTCVAASTPGRCFSPRRYGTHCDWPVYLPAFVLNSCSAPDKPRRASRKTIVPKMASVIASATVFVSTMSTASASRPSPLAKTNRQSVNLLTATTRLTRSSL